MVASCKSSKVEEMSERGYLFLMVMFLSPIYSMHSLRNMSFFSTKKNPVPPGDEDGQMIPAACESWIYCSMVLVSGSDRMKSFPLGGDVPGSMAQSYGRCSSKELAGISEASVMCISHQQFDLFQDTLTQNGRPGSSTGTGYPAGGTVSPPWKAEPSPAAWVRRNCWRHTGLLEARVGKQWIGLSPSSVPRGSHRCGW